MVSFSDSDGSEKWTVSIVIQRIGLKTKQMPVDFNFSCKTVPWRQSKWLMGKLRTPAWLMSPDLTEGCHLTRLILVVDFFLDGRIRCYWYKKLVLKRIAPT